MPEKMAVESAGAVKVKESGSVSALLVPSGFFAAMTVLGGSVTLAPARYPEEQRGVRTVVVFGVVARYRPG